MAGRCNKCGKGIRGPKILDLCKKCSEESQDPPAPKNPLREKMLKARNYRMIKEGALRMKLRKFMVEVERRGSASMRFRDILLGIKYDSLSDSSSSVAAKTKDMLKEAVMSCGWEMVSEKPYVIFRLKENG